MMKAERNLSLGGSGGAGDEASIVARLRRGDHDAAHEFYELYSARIYRFILHAIGSGADSDAEDIMQDTFMALADAIPFFRGDSSLFTFACAIAHRKSMSFLRTRVRRATVLLDETNAPSSQADAATDRDFQRILASLRADHRQVLILKYVEEMSVAEIATVLSVSQHAVESRLARGRRALSKALRED